MNTQKMSRMVAVLRGLVYLVIVLTIAEIVGAVLNDQKVYLDIGGELWSRALSAFDAADRIVIIVGYGLSATILVWGVYQLIRLCRLFDVGVIFAPETVRCFKRFAAALITLAVYDTLRPLFLIGYLWARGSIPHAPDMDPVMILGFVQADTLALGVLFFVISRIMEIGLELRSETELTI